MLLLTLTSCAGDRGRYMTSSIPYSVQRVMVVSAEPSTDQFSRELHYHLQNSVGRPPGSPGQNIDLIVQVLPNGVFNQSTRSLLSKIRSFGAASITANVRLVDPRNGMSLGYKQVIARSSSNMPHIANAKIAEDMISQIRAMLGLGLTAPHPIANRTPANAGFSHRQNGFIPSSSYSSGMYSANTSTDGAFELTDSEDVLLQRIQEIDSAMSADAQDMRNFVNRERQNLAISDQTSAQTVTQDVATESPNTDPNADLVETFNEQQDLIDNFTVGASKDTEYLSETVVDSMPSASQSITPSDLCIVTAENDCLGAQ